MSINYVNVEHLFHLPCHVYWKDLKGIYQGSNNYAANCMGALKAEEIVGFSDFDLCSAESASNFRSNDQKVIINNKSLSTSEIVIWIRNNITYSVHSHKQPLLNSMGDIIGVLGMSFLINYQSAITQNFPSFSKPSTEKCNFNSLTRRQEECLFLLVIGKNAKEIAKELNISFRTVEHHIEAIKNKFNCDSRSGLIVKALTIKAIKDKIIKL